MASLVREFDRNRLFNTVAGMPFVGEIFTGSWVVKDGEVRAVSFFHAAAFFVGVD
jgi:hypothetical protein